MAGEAARELAFAPVRALAYPERVQFVDLQHRVPIGDFDGDGVAEFFIHAKPFELEAVGAPSAWMVEIDLKEVRLDRLVRTPVDGATPVRNQTVQIAAADLDGDRDEDLVVREIQSDVISGPFAQLPRSRFVTLENRGGKFVQVGRFPDEAMLDNAFALIDLNGDGVKDVLAGQRADERADARLLRLISNGAAGFAEGQIVTFPQMEMVINYVTDAGDLNLDGFGDAWISQNGFGASDAALGGAEGTITIGPSIHGWVLESVGPDDFDGDGVIDAVRTIVPFSIAGCSPVSFLQLARGEGDGSFDAFGRQLELNGHSRGAISSDLLIDGEPVVIVAMNIQCGGLPKFLTLVTSFNGAGIGETTSLPIPFDFSDQFQIESFDVDADGDRDILLFHESGVLMFERLGAAAPSADVNQDGRVDASDIEMALAQWGQSGAADLNRDGVVDIADLSILLNSQTVAIER